MTYQKDIYAVSIFTNTLLPVCFQCSIQPEQKPTGTLRRGVSHAVSFKLTSHCRIAAAWHICRSDQGQPTDWEGVEKQDTAEWSYRSFAVFKIKNDSSIVVVTGKDKLVLRSIIRYIAVIDSPTNESIYCVLSLCHMLSKKLTPDRRHGCWHEAERLRGLH